MFKCLRPSALGVAMLLASAGATVVMPILAQAGAVEVQGLPNEAVHPADVIGQAVAAKADQQLKAEVKSYAKENLFGITGDLIPDGDVTYRRAGLCVVDGRKGVVVEFNVHARAKIDVGTRKLGVKMVRKVWAVDTVQLIQVVILPKQKDDGTVAAEVRAEIVSATATPERQAKQQHADGFRDKVSSELRKKLASFTGEYDAQSVLDRVK
jgi:hypothetical protein